jgi:hypothetical protein
LGFDLEFTDAKTPLVDARSRSANESAFCAASSFKDQRRQIASEIERTPIRHIEGPAPSHWLAESLDSAKVEPVQGGFDGQGRDLALGGKGAIEHGWTTASAKIRAMAALGGLLSPNTRVKRRYGGGAGPDEYRHGVVAGAFGCTTVTMADTCRPQETGKLTLPIASLRDR